MALDQGIERLLRSLSNDLEVSTTRQRQSLLIHFSPRRVVLLHPDCLTLTMTELRDRLSTTGRDGPRGTPPPPTRLPVHRASYTRLPESTA